MYLSKLILNPRNRQVRRDLANRHELHRTILAAFPDLPGSHPDARSKLCVLFRVESDPARTERAQIRALVQSAIRPDWSRLPDGYLQPPEDIFAGEENPACRSLDGVWETIRAGDELIFRLRANPTRRVNASRQGTDTLAGKRVELRTEAEWLAWLARKGEQHGFRLVEVRASREVAPAQVQEVLGPEAPTPSATNPVPDTRSTPGLKVTGRKERGTRPLTFGSVLFEGRLVVSDVAAFRQALATGIGSGKAYGFGLLSIARPRPG